MIFWNGSIYCRDHRTGSWSRSFSPWRAKHTSESEPPAQRFHLTSSANDPANAPAFRRFDHAADGLFKDCGSLELLSRAQLLFERVLFWRGRGSLYFPGM
jgi:hypothetical protein